jgi:hypothetical protein
MQRNVNPTGARRQPQTLSAPIDLAELTADSRFSFYGGIRAPYGLLYFLLWLEPHLATFRPQGLDVSLAANHQLLQ